MNILKKTWVLCQLFSWPSFKKLFNSILWSFGLLYSFVSVIDFFFNTWARDHLMPLWWGFVILGVLIAICRNFPKTSFACKIDNTDTAIEIRVGDIFDTDETIIVGTNTTFDTAMEDRTISPKSIQGQFTLKYCSSVNELDGKLSANLSGITPKVLSANDKPYGKTNRYPIGTVVKVDCPSRNAYFLTIAHMNKTRTAQSDTQNILDALPELWEFIRTHGELENICVPIIGSVFARVKATKEILIQEILRSFVAACSEGKFCEKITLFIQPNDIKNGKINFENTIDFLKYICMYENKRISSQVTGASKTKALNSNEHTKHIKATRFLLEDNGGRFSTRKDFRTIIENVADTIEKAIPILLETMNLKEFVEKCGKSITIREDLKFDPLTQIKNPQFKQFSTGCIPPHYNKISQWALDLKSNVYLNENAKNLFNDEFIQLKSTIE